MLVTYWDTQVFFLNKTCFQYIGSKGFNFQAPRESYCARKLEIIHFKIAPSHTYHGTKWGEAAMETPLMWPPFRHSLAPARWFYDTFKRALKGCWFYSFLRWLQNGTFANLNSKSMSQVKCDWGTSAK